MNKKKTILVEKIEKKESPAMVILRSYIMLAIFFLILMFVYSHLPETSPFANGVIFLLIFVAILFSWRIFLKIRSVFKKQKQF